MRVGIVAFTVIGVVLVGSAAFAQERGRVGLSTGYPPNIGVLWHITERVAIRPGVSFRHTSLDPSGNSFSLSGSGSSITSTSSSESTVAGVRVDALFTLGTWDNVRAYVAPGYEYGRTSSRTVTTTVSTGPFAPPNSRTETREIHGHDHEAIGTFGARYVPHPRFGVFGEVGVSYSKSQTTFFETPSKARTWGTTTGAGVIFYF